jgi:hypothetical protein
MICCKLSLSQNRRHVLHEIRPFQGPTGAPDILFGSSAAQSIRLRLAPIMVRGQG